MLSNSKIETFQGIKWSVIEKFGAQFVKFIAGLVLARLLSPDDFGLVGLIMVIFLIAQVIIESGLGKAYIQKKQVSPVDANTIFYFNLLLSVLIYLIIYISSPFIANFYDQPTLIKLIRIMGLTLIINSLSIIQNSEIIKILDFKRRAKIMLTSSILSSIVAIYLALFDFGVWSLVYLYLSYSTFVTLGLWNSSTWKPKLIFSIKSLKEMLSFGIWILFSGIVRTFFDNIYILIIGKFFSVTQVGFYTRSKQFQQLITQQFSQSIANVSFPVFSKLQDKRNDLYNNARMFISFTLACIVPILVSLVIVAKPFVEIVLTNKWLPMVPYLQLLCIVGIFYPIHLINLQILIASGKSRLNFNLVLIKGGLRLINILLTYQYGIIFIIIGEVFVSLFSLIINTYYTKKIIGYGFKSQIYDISHIFFCGIISCIIGYLLTYFIFNQLILLIFSPIIIILSYLILMWIINKNIFNDIKLVLKNHNNS